MGKEETLILIRPAHTSPSNNKTKQEWKHGKATDNCGEWAIQLCTFEPHGMVIELKQEMQVNKNSEEFCFYYTAHL